MCFSCLSHSSMTKEWEPYECGVPTTSLLFMRTVLRSISKSKPALQAKSKPTPQRSCNKYVTCVTNMTLSLQAWDTVTFPINLPSFACFCTARLGWVMGSHSILQFSGLETPKQMILRVFMLWVTTSHREALQLWEVKLVYCLLHTTSQTHCRAGCFQGHKV